MSVGRPFAFFWLFTSKASFLFKSNESIMVFDVGNVLLLLAAKNSIPEEVLCIWVGWVKITLILSRNHQSHKTKKASLAPFADATETNFDLEKHKSEEIIKPATVKRGKERKGEKWQDDSFAQASLIVVHQRLCFPPRLDFELRCIHVVLFLGEFGTNRRIFYGKSGTNSSWG